jgi:hypothetical protein
MSIEQNCSVAFLLKLSRRADHEDIMGGNQTSTNPM